MSVFALRGSLALVCFLGIGCGADLDAVADQGSGLGGEDAGSVVGDGGLTVWDSSVFPGNPYDGGGVVYPDAGNGECGSVRAETMPVRAPVDVVWALDGSGSMGPHALSVGDNMLKFMDGVRAGGANINVTMLTGFTFGLALQAAIPDPNYKWIIADVQSHDAFRQLINNFGQYGSSLRPGAPLHIIVVTDDTSNMPAADFQREMSALLGRPYFVHAVAATGLGTSCAGAGPGTEYFNAAMATGGEEILLCSNWSEVVQKLTTNVIASAPLPCDYTIPQSPDGSSLDPQKVQVVYTPTGGADEEFAKAATQAQCGDFRGWYFDDELAPTKVMMCPAACEAVKAGGGISLGFGCAPSVVLR